MTIDEMIAVLRAAKAGKQIEAQYRLSPDSIFKPTSHPTWDFYDYDYRVKPEPREGFIQPAWLMTNPPTTGAIKVREVL